MTMHKSFEIQVFSLLSALSLTACMASGGSSSPSPGGPLVGAANSAGPGAPIGTPAPGPVGPAVPTLTPPAGNATPTTTTNPTTPTAAPVIKKGAALWFFDGVDPALADVNAGWFYTWRANASGINAPAGVPFVPMIWGPNYVDATDLASAKAAGGTLLGFNEPDHPDQSNMSVQQALSLWPQLMANGQRLGAPATANDPSQSGSWLEQFMAGAKAAGYRVDFICIHWYGSGTDPQAMTQELQTLIANTYAKFNLPIWVTEYSLINYDGGAQATPAQEAAFATASMAMLDSLPYVERYSWYAMPPQGNYSLYTDSGSETVVGTAYKAGS